MFFTAESEDKVWRKILKLQELSFLHSVSEMDQSESFNEMKDIIIENKILYFRDKYLVDCDYISLTEEEVSELQSYIDEEIVKIDDEIEEAKRDMGSVEVFNGKYKKAQLLCKIGKVDEGFAIFQECDAIPMGDSTKMKSVFLRLLISFCCNDFVMIEKWLADIDIMAQNNVLDFEHKNRLLTYRGLFSLMKGNFLDCVNDFIECLNTFMATELIDFERLVFYLCVFSVITLKRPRYRDYVLNSSDVKTVINSLEDIEEFSNNFYNGNYKEGLKLAASIKERLKTDYYCHKFESFFFYNFRKTCYRQFLKSYSRVTLAKIAEEFSLPIKLVELDLVEFIQNGDLTFRIDELEGVVHRANRISQDVKQFSNAASNTINKLENLARVLAM
ncbi:hypothetical protein PCE1_002315 [Barthelona sp. PCE]